MRHTLTAATRSRTARMALVIALALTPGLAGRSSAQPGPTQTSEGGGVTLKATWLEPRDRLEFKIVLDTHSVDLDGYDLRALATLRAEHVRSVSPIAWDAPKGGHHREGTLRFPARDAGGAGVYAADRAYTLSIRDVAGVPLRTFTWRTSKPTASERPPTPATAAPAATVAPRPASGGGIDANSSPMDSSGTGMDQMMRAASAWPSYDIGAPGPVKPTGRVRAFTLVAREAPWEIAPGVAVPAITYNGVVPGPPIRVTEGDTLRVTIRNELTKATAIHWHGLHVPNGMDGVPPFTQKPIEPGQSFTYEFPVSHAGSFMYHSHLNAVEQIDRGLYGLLIIDPARPTRTRFDKEFSMVISAWNTNAAAASENASTSSSMAEMGDRMNYNYFTINGKAFPGNPEWVVRQGDLVRVRIVNISNMVHPMHLHGGDFTVVAKNGEPVRPMNQETLNTLAVNAGETYEIVFRADNPGTWVFHCHELHHTENDGVEPGGLIQVIRYEGVKAVAPGATIPMAGMPGMR